ncbi:MAG: hypothetical protein ABH821_01715 [archaeon]
MESDKTESVDAVKAAYITREYFQNQHGNLGILLFRIDKVFKNSLKNTWVVKCSLNSSVSGKERLSYTLKVNVKDGKVTYIGPENEKE